MSTNKNNKNILSVPLSWIILSSIFFVVFAVAVWSYVIVSRPAAIQNPTTTPLLMIITPERISTDSTTSISIATDISEIIQTPTFPPPPAGSLIKLGSYVQVVNTGGGLRLRYEPSLESEVNYLALDYEVFIVEDGPREVDDMTWWYLVGQSDDRRNGWAAANYLQVIR